MPYVRRVMMSNWLPMLPESNCCRPSMQLRQRCGGVRPSSFPLRGTPCSPRGRTTCSPWTPRYGPNEMYVCKALAVDELLSELEHTGARERIALLDASYRNPFE